MIVKILLAAALVSCAYDARFEDCTVSCTSDSGCPGDLKCGPESFCRTSDVPGSCSSVLGVNPSCLGLAATCGPNTNENCCATAEPIPGGTFYRSYDVSGDGMYPSTSYPATVSPFVLDRFQITVGRFRKFVKAGGGTQLNTPIAGEGAHPKLAGSGWDSIWNGDFVNDTSILIDEIKCGSGSTWTDVPGDNEELPVNCVTWFEMMAFCIWDGGYLPTEAEWNFAAAGGDEQRVYPWSKPAASNEIDCSYGNYRDGSTQCVQNGAKMRVGSYSPKGDGKWGQADLSGNNWELTLDWYAPYANPCNDCASLSPTATRIDRGGSAGTEMTDLRTARRGTTEPSFRRNSIGARCARSSTM